MEALENPYFEPGRRLLYKKGLTAKQLARLLYLDQANSFWSALYDVDSPTLLENPPYDLLEERDAHSLEYLNKVQFLLNWLRSFVIIRGQYETNAFIHLKNLENLLAESRKNERTVIYSKLGGQNLDKLKGAFNAILRKFGVVSKPPFANWLLFLDKEQFNGEPPEGLGELQATANNAFIALWEILNKYKDIKDGLQIPDPANAYHEAEEMKAEARKMEARLLEVSFNSPEAFQAVSETADLARIASEDLKEKAERLEEEGANKMALIEETFKQLTKYVLFLRGSRIVLNSIARVFKSTPDAWITRPERLKELETGVASILVEIELFTTRKIDGKRQTLEEAQAEQEAFEKMEGGPERLKLWEELRTAKGNPVFDYLDDFWRLGGTASPEFEGPDVMSLWETRNFWRPLALKLKEALNKTWRPTDILKADTHAKAINFMGSQSDMEYIFEFCGIKE